MVVGVVVVVVRHGEGVNFVCLMVVVVVMVVEKWMRQPVVARFILVRHYPPMNLVSPVSEQVRSKYILERRNIQ